MSQQLAVMSHHDATGSCCMAQHSDGGKEGGSLVLPPTPPPTALNTTLPNLQSLFSCGAVPYDEILSAWLAPRDKCDCCAFKEFPFIIYSLARDRYGLPPTSL